MPLVSKPLSPKFKTNLYTPMFFSNAFFYVSETCIAKTKKTSWYIISYHWTFYSANHVYVII
ncbi:MAG: hypothetical protein EAZ67_10750 [Cytophagales bacterium]|nr:MAG: hypothetical protein EAZ67_10750 [Cytophagales bacterium]